MGLLEKDATDILAALRAGQVSCEALMRATLSRIDTVNKAVNAIVSMRKPES